MTYVESTIARENVRRNQYGDASIERQASVDHFKGVKTRRKDNPRWNKPIDEPVVAYVPSTIDPTKKYKVGVEYCSLIVHVLSFTQEGQTTYAVRLIPETIDFSSLDEAMALVRESEAEYAARILG